MCSSVHMPVQMLPYILSVMDIHLDFVVLVNIFDRRIMLKLVSRGLTCFADGK